ncbi:MAG: helix-turn-helix domain-containing protein [Theionarchaea archaeon]|nr:helix-turn-helix domain-containing protein [Theionarchaea archaeon]MBU7000925.1 helix-turn-helix domain-containing protein [Theionarchaea archaeon]MBU7021133.1 helix-turn-helix domain-containing protein [Theionarchaea archaeon]MBU7033860.1 helix-turn-helix domain-containing protein [Theionarchaea archaeon]MBU7041283.1 helix-turn-helix domain-containing protein [Theionarchaea archaeon]
MYYARLNIYHAGGLCNRISRLDHVKSCLIDRADVFKDGSVYIELSVRFSKPEHSDVVQQCISHVPEDVTLIDVINAETVTKLRYIIGPEANSVIRETNKMGFILDYPVIVQDEKEIISGIVYKDVSLQEYFDVLAKANLKYKIKKIVRNDRTRRMSFLKWSWPLSTDVHLTEMQRKTIHAAFEHGYYSFPRKIDIKTIAVEMGISTSTAWEHLRKAEMKLMNFVLEEQPM